ncbi:MAG TPA: hypothetical protein VFG32_07720 [Bacteroidota bacterium]|nr:hypothetical protein [Bacteroidota bacterium]
MSTCGTDGKPDLVGRGGATMNERIHRDDLVQWPRLRQQLTYGHELPSGWSGSPSASSTYARCVISSVLNLFLIAVTFPVVAQSPKETT